MKCIKCNGLMTQTEIYTEDYGHIKALRCMNCGKHEYAPLELRVIPIKDYKLYDKHRGKGRMKRIITCHWCKKESEGYGYKYCSRKCQNDATNRNTRTYRKIAKGL